MIRFHPAGVKRDWKCSCQRDHRRRTLNNWAKSADRVFRAALGRRRLSCVSIAVFLLVLLGQASESSGQGSKADPDLQVSGFAVFGTNVAGSTSVTSGWGSAYMDGSLQVRSNLHVGGMIVSTNLIQAMRHGLTQRDQTLTPGATIQPVSSYVRIQGDGASVVLGNPQIAPGTPGQLLTLQGVSSLFKVTLVDGAGLQTMLNQPFNLGEFDTIQFIYDDSSGNWVEINRSQNRWAN